MKKLVPYLGILISLGIIFSISGFCYAWVIGENRLSNSDFEGDEIGQKPKEWDLEKGG